MRNKRQDVQRHRFDERLFPRSRHALVFAATLGLALTGCSDGGSGGADEPVSISAQDDPTTEAECGDVSIAMMNWGSAGTLAEIDKLILSAGFGCATTLVAGDTLPTFESMKSSGQPDLAPELWIDPFRESLNESTDAGDLIVTTQSLQDGGEEGWWIPRYIAEANPDIRTIEDALMRPELFPSPTGSALSGLHTCPSGWNCSVSNENLFRAYGGEGSGFELVDPVTAEGLDLSVANAFQRQEGWLGYYWSPTALMGRYDMVKLASPPHDRAEWASCTSVRDCANPTPTGYLTAEVVSVVTADFAERGGAAIDYLSARQWSNEIVSEVLAWIVENNASPEEGAVHFVENYEDIWRNWVDEATGRRVKASL